MSVGYSSIAVLGYLGHDPEMMRAERGTKGARFSVAVNRVWTNELGERQEETDWFRIIAWGQLAETCLAYLAKGRLVFVVGKPRTRRWEDREGQDREQLQVLAKRVIFLDRPEPDEEDVED